MSVDKFQQPIEGMAILTTVPGPTLADLVNSPRTLGGAGSGNFGHAGRPGQVGGSSTVGGELFSPDDAMQSLLNGEQANIAREDVRTFLYKAAAQGEDPDLTDLHVDGMLIFGGNGLGVARADMPQVPRENRDAFIADLRQQGVSVRREHVSPLSVFPTQKEISARHVGEILKSYDEHPGWFEPIVVSRDNHIIDGHHTWGVMAAVAIDHPHTTIPIFKIDLPTRRLMAVMKRYQQQHGFEQKDIHTLGGPGSGDVVGHPFHGNQWTDGGSWPLADTAPRVSTPSEAVERAYAPWVDSLTDEERNAFDVYTADGDYSAGGNATMNNALRGTYDHAPAFAATKAKAEASAAVITEALAKSTVKPPPLVWRGVEADIDRLVPDLTPGAEVVLKGFQSTSVSPDMARNFGHTVLEIHPSHGAYLSGLVKTFSQAEHAYGPGEGEFLLPHAARYRVRGVVTASLGGKPTRLIQLDMQ